MTRLSLALVALLLAGCGQTAFSPSFRDNAVEDLKTAISGTRPPTGFAPQNRTGAPLMFAVLEKPSAIVAIDLGAGKQLWKVETEVSSKVIVGKGRIFHRAGKSSLIARDLGSGGQIWQHTIAKGDRLVGLCTNGDDLFYVTENLKRDDEGNAAFLMALDGSRGALRWMRPSTGRLGAPSVWSNRLFVPLRSQSLAIVDTETGGELARIRSREEMLLWALPSTAGFLYGSKSGVYRLDERSVSGTRTDSSFVAAALPPAVRPAYWSDGYNAALVDYTAYDRTRLLWQVIPDKMAFQDNAIYVHNYRFFFAFDTEKKSGDMPLLKWVYSFPRHDVVASVHTGKALVVLSNNGTVVSLDLATGAPLAEIKLDLPVRGASFDADGFMPSGRPTSPDLRESLTRVIWDPDRRFGAVKLFAVEQLARLPGASVAQDLVKIVTYPGIDPGVYKLAGQMIVDRHEASAVPLYIETLKARYDFIEETHAAAVDIMARALGDLKAKEAVQPLLVHLMDQETSIPTVEEIVKALIAIGDPAVVVPFRDWLLTYRADQAFEESSLVLNLIADGLLKLGTEEERQLLSFVQNDSQTIKPLRTYLAEALKQTQ